MVPPRLWGLPASLALAVAVSAVFSVLFFSDLYATTRLANACAMTYSRPMYTKLVVPPATDEAMQHTHAKYTFSMLHMGNDPRFASATRSYVGVPVLFVPGHLGSYMQARSFGQHLTDRYTDHGIETRGFDLFLVDFNEEATGFTGHFMAEQGYFINEAVREILRLYSRRPSPPTSVIVIAHSMGGIAVRTAMTLPNYRPGSIRTIVTLSTPHVQPPFPLDTKMHGVYGAINDAWRAFRPAFDDVVVVSVAGGHKDLVIHSSLASLEGLVPAAHGMALLTSSMPSVQTSMDHLCLLWCHQLLATLTGALDRIIDPATHREIADPAVRFETLRAALLGDGHPSLNVPGFAAAERDQYPIRTPQVILDLTRTHYIVAFPVLFGVALAILATQMERWQRQAPDTAPFTALLAPSVHWQYPLQHALSGSSRGALAVACALLAVLVALDALINVVRYAYVYLYVLGSVYVLARLLGRVCRPLSYAAPRAGRLFRAPVLLGAAAVALVAWAHGAAGLPLDVSRELSLLCLAVLAAHVLTWLSLLLAPSAAQGLATYQATVFALYAAVLPCWLGEAVYYADVVRFPRAVDGGFLYTVARSLALVGPCLGHVLLARKYYFPLPPAAMFARQEGAPLPSGRPRLAPETCTGCFVEDGGPGAVFVEATTADTVVVGSVVVGPTFRVIACDCGARFAAIADYCAFCKRLCVECGGGEIARQHGRAFREYMHQMHETVVAHESATSLLWLLLLGGLGYTCVSGNMYCLVYLGAGVGAVASAYHVGLRGPLDLEDGLAPPPKVAEPLLHEVPKTKPTKTK
ncbi:GPI inositol-deacylase [Achlya hypogyna]|uniref:GPI inositol-deacylase n=1 Tax=Achlya hypogyna TaxID=1202772 RepID=A0A1V9YN36_ACHHY|nr:GPI inositol-deacylase [Achlya hypogyna]